MRKINEVLRLKWEKGFSARQIAKSCDIARSTVTDYLDRAKLKGLTWPLPDDLDDAAVEHLLFPSAAPIDSDKRVMPPMEYIHRELKRKKVTLQLLWYEYKKANPDGYQYSQFCEHYHRWRGKLDVCLRQTYRAGEKLFVDYAGQTIPVTDPLTGKTREAYLFVATLGASNYTFAWGSFSQDLPSWIDAHVRALDFFGAVPEIVVPDNLLSGVTKPSYYEPDINPTYLDFSLYCGTVIIPARVRKPKDKAKVETAVKIAEMWILAALRNHTFFSLDELNKAVVEKLVELNDRKFKKMDGTRRSLFETIDKPAMKPLPLQAYQYAEWKKPAVNIDYHITVDDHHYSVPHQLFKERVDVRLTATTVEVLFKNNRVASHARSYQKWQHTTLPEHMPKSHQKYLEWSPSRIIAWAGKNGPNTAFCTSALENALKISHSEIFNADQGSQFTSNDFTGILEKEGILISMDGKGRAYDNIFVERLWRSVKYEEVYLHQYPTVAEARKRLNQYFMFYNTERIHESLGYKTPYEIYFKELLKQQSKQVA